MISRLVPGTMASIVIGNADTMIVTYDVYEVMGFVANGARVVVPVQ